METVFISQKHFKDLFSSRAEQTHAWRSVQMHCRKKLPFHDQPRLVQPSPSAWVQLQTSPPVSKASPLAHRLFFCHQWHQHVSISNRVNKPAVDADWTVRAGEAAGHRAAGCRSWRVLSSSSTVQDSQPCPTVLVAFSLLKVYFLFSFVSENMASGSMAVSLLKLYFLVLVLTDHDASDNASPREDKKLRQRLIDSSCWCFPAAAGRSFVPQEGFSSAFAALHTRCCSWNAIAWQFLRGQTGLQTTCSIIITKHVPEKAYCRLPLFIKKKPKRQTTQGTRTKNFYHE